MFYLKFDIVVRLLYPFGNNTEGELKYSQMFNSISELERYFVSTLAFRKSEDIQRQCNDILEEFNNTFITKNTISQKDHTVLTLTETATEEVQKVLAEINIEEEQTEVT